MDFSALQRTSKITDEWRYPEAAGRLANHPLSRWLASGLTRLQKSAA